MRRWWFLALSIALLLPSTALAAGADPSLPLLFYLVFILLSAKLMGHIVALLGQALVLGELCAGILLGNLGLLCFQGFEGIAANPYVDILARIGAIVLLFEVGLESTIRDILNVGPSSFLVAGLGGAGHPGGCGDRRRSRPRHPRLRLGGDPRGGRGNHPRDLAAGGDHPEGGGGPGRLPPPRGPLHAEDLRHGREAARAGGAGRRLPRLLLPPCLPGGRGGAGAPPPGGAA